MPRSSLVPSERLAQGYGDARNSTGPLVFETETASLEAATADRRGSARLRALLWICHWLCRDDRFVTSAPPVGAGGCRTWAAWDEPRLGLVAAHLVDEDGDGGDRRVVLTRGYLDPVGVPDAVPPLRDLSHFVAVALDL